MKYPKEHSEYLIIRERLISELNSDGFWTGQLSTSALSTAVAIVALRKAGFEGDREKVSSGLNWLSQNINNDGGYGDTPQSNSNVSTTLLCYAAFKLCQNTEIGPKELKQIEKWLSVRGIDPDSDTIATSVLKFYGSDYTFSIPILSMLSVCGAIPESSFRKIPALPFEFALLPASWYRFFNLRVVSYALPALIGVGIYLHKHRRKGFFSRGILRDLFVKPAVAKLNKLVPESGGFLEAIPLTGFVAMCLVECGETNNITIEKGLEFLRVQQYADGGWPIDTDLSTWVTTLSVKALGKDLKEVLNVTQIDILRKHLLDLQYKTIHPFNHASPGGWGWSSYSGSVPDADDTPGAILALLEIYSGSKEEKTAIENGCRWLVDLQNSDGGFPTFCRGWGKLPFDRSCADLTGHALLALMKSAEILTNLISPELLSRIDKSIVRAINYLTKQQADNGSWVPLWFGNQNTKDLTNPVYGTAKVCIYLNDCLSFQRIGNVVTLQLSEIARKAQNYLLTQQNNDGSWGGEKGISGSIEETSLSISALSPNYKEVCRRGIEWISTQETLTPAPIGLFFSLLWYDEKLYPVIYYTEALRRFLS